jgi:hypothetical protein
LPDYPRGLDFQQVWAALMETRERIKETEQIVKENVRIIGNPGNRLGDVIEYMFAPNLHEKFKELGLVFPKANQNSKVRDYDNNILDLFGNPVSSRTSPAFFRAERLPAAISALQKCFFNGSCSETEVSEQLYYETLFHV